MCRGAKLGPCMVVGCDNDVRCRDNAGYCDSHSDSRLCYCEGDCTCPPAEPDPPVDERKKLTYFAARSEEHIASLRATLTHTNDQLHGAIIRQAERKARLAAITASRPETKHG